MGMQFRASCLAVQVEVIQKHEWLEHLTKVARSHEARDLAVTAASRSMDDLSRNHRVRHRMNAGGGTSPALT